MFKTFATRAIAAAALVVASVGAQANLLNNGSFETGDFTGWTQFGNTGFTGVTTSFFGPPTDGSYQSIFGPVGSFGGISQTLSSGAGTYTIDFDMGQSSGNGNYVTFDGNTIMSNMADTQGQWQHFSFTVAGGPNAVLAFGFQNDPSYYALDNVVVTLNEAPEPGSLALLGLGLAGIAAARRNKVKAA